ncbi:FAD-binding oxidoreductase [Candidatus Saccharibacteria bacterium]|nr:FAD-binding oxidoreductase [Candidatus Saccharibacteria bacterium]
MNKIAKYLNQHLVGNVFDSEEILAKYAGDRSVVKVTPKMVVVPEDTNDVRKVVRFVSQLAKKDVRLELAVRGSGLDKTGADLGKDILISMENMDKIQEIDERSRLVRVQAGVKLGTLNQALGLVGLTVPINADPEDTIGSLISNFITDSYAGKNNGIYYYTDCLEAVISTGDVIQTTRYSKRGLAKKEALTTPEGALYRDLHTLIDDNYDLISDLRSRSTVDCTGYQMLTQVLREQGHTFDLMPMFFAAQGTLGIITEVILRCEVLPESSAHFAAAFSNVKDAVEYASSIKSLNPLEINLYDARIFGKSADAGKDPNIFSKKFSNGWMLLVAFNDSARKSRRKIAKCLRNLPETAAAIIEDEGNMTDFERIKTALNSFKNDNLRGERAPILDDLYIPLDKVPEFVKTLKSQEEVYDMELPLMGSTAANNYCIRPDLRLNSVEGRQIAVRLIKDVAKILNDHEGSLTGGSPEGRTKAIAAYPELSDAEVELYTKVKDVFDPLEIFNPSIKLGASLKDTVKNLRTSYLEDITR